MKKIILWLFLLMAITGCGQMLSAVGHDYDGPYTGGFGISVYNNTDQNLDVLYRGRIAAILPPGGGKRILVGYYYDYSYNIVGRIKTKNRFCLVEKLVYIGYGGYGYGYGYGYGGEARTIIFHRQDFRCF